MTTTKFCTVSQAKAHLNTVDTYADDDDKIVEHIVLATALIRKYTRRNWERATYTQLFDTQQIEIALQTGRNVAQFILKEKPVISVESVKYHTGGQFAEAAALDSSVYTVDPARNRIMLWPSRMDYNTASLSVEYVAGYEPDVTDPALLLVDPALASACAVQAAFTFRRVINEDTGKKQKSSKIGSYSAGLTSSGLIPEAQALLKSETRIMVGGNG